MDNGRAGKPTPPDVPEYVREPLEKQSPERLELVASYASELAEWKRRQRRTGAENRRREEAIGADEKEELADREVSTDPAEYEGVPSNGAYITIKTTKRTSETEYRYYYWQWREGDTWKNEYIAPVDPG